MMRRYWFLLFALLWPAACAPGPMEFEPTLRATATAESTPLPTGTVEAVETAMATLEPTPAPPATMPATEMPALPTKTPIATVAATPTEMPFTDVSPWRILFEAVICDEGECISMLTQEFPSMQYLINSDGSELTPLVEMGPREQDFLRTVKYTRYSSDHSWMAYLAEGHIYWTMNSSGSQLSFTPVPASFRGMDFLPDNECLAVYIEQSENDNVQMSEILIQKVCPDGTDVPLDWIQLPKTPRPTWFNYRLSPDGTKLLAYGLMPEDRTPVIFVKGIGQEQPARLIYNGFSPCPEEERQRPHAQSPNNRIVNARWQPDNETIEFLLIALCHNADQSQGARVMNAFYTIGWQGESLSPRLLYEQEQFAGKYETVVMETGDWSPDGQVFVFTYQEGLDSEHSGLYILNLNTGAIYQILENFLIWEILIWASPYIPGVWQP
jgi:hypothetical protein